VPSRGKIWFESTNSIFFSREHFAFSRTRAERRGVSELECKRKREEFSIQISSCLFYTNIYVIFHRDNKSNKGIYTRAAWYIQLEQKYGRQEEHNEMRMYRRKASLFPEQRILCNARIQRRDGARYMFAHYRVRIALHCKIDERGRRQFRNGLKGLCFECKQNNSHLILHVCISTN
jgi:hypothetical protein